MALVDCICENCGKEFKRKRYQHNFNTRKGRRVMCSRACVVVGNLGEGNGNAHPKGPRWQSAKKAVIRERGETCQCCGWKRDAVDACHILDRADGGLDTPDNLLLLCPNDHRLFDGGLLTNEELERLESSMQLFGYTIKLRKEGNSAYEVHSPSRA